MSAIVLPVFLFYFNLFRTALDLPILDDYEAILGFMNRWATSPSITDRLIWFLTSQHVEVKLFLLHAIVLVQYAVLGHVNFRFLSLFSEGLLLGLAYLLWKMFVPKSPDTLLRLTLFLPVTFLLFQLQYSLELSVVTQGMAHIAGLLFSLAALYELNRDNRRSFVAALAFLLLAVASFGNGFMVVPIGMLILARKRRYKELGLFLAISLACVAIYAYRFDFHVPEGGVVSVPQFNWLTIPKDCLYVVYFLGSAGGLNSHFPPGGLILGILLVATFVWMLATGQMSKNFLPFDCAMFLLLSAATAASRRAAFGVTQSLDPRYSLYSITFVILLWILLVERFLPRLRHPWNSGLFLAVMVCSVLFCLCWNMIGVASIRQRNDSVVAAITRFQHPDPNAPERYPVPPYRYPGPNGEADGVKLRERMLSNLNLSAKLGVYRPQF
ncbi:MAG: hypothetical protein WCA10_19210 [Terracidiphilus sp.]